MKSTVENKKKSILDEDQYEEIAYIPEKVAMSDIIDGEENFEEDSVIEVDLNGFEELGEINVQSLKSMTIIDEFENAMAEKDMLPDRNDSTIDIEKLTIQINELTSIQKHKKIKEYTGQIPHTKIVSLKEEEKSSVLEKGKEIAEIKEKQIKQQEGIEKKQPIEEKIDIKLEKERKDEHDSSLSDSSSEKKISKRIEVKSQEETTTQDSNNLLKPAKGNILTIEIPDKLLKEVPAGFNINELGKIDLNEAEIIAGEDILSLAKGELLKELEELNMLPEQNKKIQINKRENIRTEDIKSESPKEKPVERDIKKFKQKNIMREEIIAVKEEKKEKLNSIAEEENIFIFDNGNLNTEDMTGVIPRINELGDIKSGITEVIEGKAKQLAESDIKDRKTISGLIRDNYPTFKDLLKEKEIENKQIYSDDDITFIDNSFFTKGQATKSIRRPIPAAENIAKERITAPYEQILGLIPDELELIENQLFNIKAKEIDLDKTILKITGFDQHPSDTFTLNKYKYILPVPDSLLDSERRSIEDDISTTGALIYEEDVDKIKKKLEDSMKKKIKETINDITDRITIYEENKNYNRTTKNNTEEKEEIKKLLKYLDELFEKLPEESIKDFVNSEYYELYNKVLKDMDI